MMEQPGYAIRHADGIVEVEFSRHLEGAMFGTILQEALNRPDGPARGLILISSVQGLNPPGSKIEKAACLLGEHGYRFSNRAAIVVPEPLQFGLARMFEVYAERRGVRCRPFWSVADARAWLESG